MTERPGPLVMGVLNVTPDSFSDGGRYVDEEAAVLHGLALTAQGARLVDVGGESTRPGAARPDAEAEAARVVPVVTALAARGVTVSVDTMRAEVAEAAIAAGAALVNDVSGGLADPRMVPLVAEAGVTFVAMHWRGHADRMHERAHYDDVVGEVVGELRERVEALADGGVDPERVVLDPGFGFSKEADHNWRLLAGLDAVTGLGHRVLVGTSRKRFLGTLGGPGPPSGPDGGAPPAGPVPPDRRDAATAATSLLAAQAGAWAVRVHDVPSTRDALAVWDRVRRARG